MPELRIIFFCLLFCISTFLTQQTVYSATPLETEYKVKAIMLSKISKFVRWPNTTKKTLDICTLGENLFGAALNAIVGVKVNDKSIQIHRKIEIDGVLMCDMVFISATEKSQLLEILTKLKPHQILTVSDNPEFARLGGMLNMVIINKKIRFQVNLKTAKDSGIDFSARFLSIATQIKTGED